MISYFASVPPEDAAWGAWFLSGNRMKRLVSTGLLREWIAEETGYPSWLVADSYASVGDLAETIALLLGEPEGAVDELPLHRWVDQIAALRTLDDGEKRRRVTGWWRSLPSDQRFVLNKLLTGALRVGVSRRLVTRALARLAGQDPAIIAHRLMGAWKPSAEAFQALVAPGPVERHPSMPYPFYLASPLEADPASLGPVEDWYAEWKWDGIRAQLIRRSGAVHLWSRGEEPLDGRFPEVEAAAAGLADGTVIDGELMAWRDGPLPFNVLQTRIARKRPGAKALAKAPVTFLAYDLLEDGGDDLRERPLCERRAVLQTTIGTLRHDRLVLSDRLAADSWSALAAARETARDRGVEGLMLKRRQSSYGVGRTRGDWWKWKVDPYTIDAVLIYAQAGHGRRANQYTDYTLAVWADDETLVPVAKAYSGLDNAEISELDRWIRRHTLERFGPVRSVEPHQVFELAFEGINRSPRHKSGVALRFPRIARWRRDLSIRDADRLDDVRRLLGTDDY